VYARLQARWKIAHVLESWQMGYVGGTTIGKHTTYMGGQDINILIHKK
jgi:hypothetical protein